MEKEDWQLWQEHDLAADKCKLTRQQRDKLEKEVPHLFAENTGAGERNGLMAGDLAVSSGRHILRVASRHNTAAASRQPTPTPCAVIRTSLSKQWRPPDGGRHRTKPKGGPARPALFLWHAAPACCTGGLR